MTALAGESKGWVNHPATKMWRGYEYELLKYSMAIRDELKERGFKWENNWHQLYDTFRRNFNGTTAQIPFWQTNSEYFRKILNTHRANLFIKNKEHYTKYFLDEMIYQNNVCCDRCNYFWVTHVDDGKTND